MRLYHYPSLYDLLLTPSDEELRLLDRIWAATEPTRLPSSVFDPACGPGTRLKPWAERGLYLAGNDLEPAMLEEAKARFAASPSEWTLGDMRHLAFSRRDFDLAVNLDASVSHLPDDEAVLVHLRSVASHLRPGGLYIYSLPIFEGRMLQTRPKRLFESGWREHPCGGRARIVYESLRRDPDKRRESIRLTVWTEALPSFPPFLCEEYDLLTFSRSTLQRLLAAAPFFSVFQILDLGDEDAPCLSLAEVENDILLALRRC